MEVKNNAPWVMLDTNLLIKLSMTRVRDLTDGEKKLVRKIKEGEVNVIINPISYGEFKYNPLTTFSRNTMLLRTFHIPRKGTGQLMVFEDEQLFGTNGLFESVLEIANEYSFDKNRQKRVPYCEFNDRLTAALAARLGIPFVSIDNHLVDKKRREHIKKTNKKNGISERFSYPVTTEEYIENFDEFFKLQTQQGESEYFELVSLSTLGTNSVEQKRTEDVIDSYRGEIDNSVYEQLKSVLYNEISNPENASSLKSMEEYLLKCYDANTEYDSLDERIEKAKKVAVEYVFTSTALVFFLMEYVSHVKYTIGDKEIIKRDRLEEIKTCAEEFGFTFVYNGDEISAIEFKGLSFSLCKKGKGRYHKVHDILGQKMGDEYKLNCNIDTDKLDDVMSMALILHGAVKPKIRTKISKKFAWKPRGKDSKIKMLSNKELEQFITKTVVHSISEKDIEKYGDDVYMSGICKTLMYLENIWEIDNRQPTPQ